jgi:predicted Zn-dependent peptidase
VKLANLPVQKPKKMSAQKSTILIIHRPQLVQAQIRVGFRVPGMTAPGTYALQIANTLLGSTF